MNSHPKILIVGKGAHEIYGPAFVQSLQQKKIECKDFFWLELEEVKHFPAVLNKLYFRFFRKIIRRKINCELMKKVESFQPEIIFFYRGVMVVPETLEKLRAKGKILLAYNNDDPFSSANKTWEMRNFLDGLKSYHWIFSYRDKNIQDYRNLGFQNTSLFLPYYRKEKNRYLGKKKEGVVFIGHYEKDGRDQICLNLLREGIPLEIYGTGWKTSTLYQELRDLLGRDIFPLYSDSYNEKLNDALISLVFFSKINNDEYTRRCFEIPLCKTVMISEKSPAMAKILKEKEEILFFSDFDSCKKNILNLLENPLLAGGIAERAYKKILAGPYEVGDRVDEVLNKGKEFLSAK